MRGDGPWGRWRSLGMKRAPRTEATTLVTRAPKKPAQKPLTVNCRPSRAESVPASQKTRPLMTRLKQPREQAMGTKAIHCGEMGQGSVVKLIGNSVISFMLEALCEGIVLGGKAGIPLQTIVDVVQASGYSSPYYAFKGAAIAKRDFDEHFAIDLLVKDQTLMLQQAAALKVPMPGLAAVREVFQAARAQGFGREDICAVVKTLERAAGETV